MNSRTGEMKKVIDRVYRELSKWDMRAACNDNPIAALIFLFFLKFTSDNKAYLNLDEQESLNFNDDINILFRDKDKYYAITCKYAKNIEERLGRTNGVLDRYARNLELLKHRDNIAPLLSEIKTLDLTLTGANDFSFRDSIIEFIMMQSKKEIRFAVHLITELSLAKLISNIAQVEENMDVYDFASGYGISLSEATKGKNVEIYAQDINEVCSAVTMMLLIFSLNTKLNVFFNDSLANPCSLIKDRLKIVNRQFDRVISVPSMGIKTSIRDYNPEAFEFRLDDISKGDLLFAQHLLASLKRDGRGILVMPVGALNRGGREAELRRGMLDNNYIDAIIELPVGMVPPTLIKTAIVVFEKSRLSDEIFFMNLGSNKAIEYQQRVGRGVRITDTGVDAISDCIKGRTIETGLTKLIPRQEVLLNDAKLGAGAYIESVPEEEEFDTPDIRLLRERNREITTHLKELNDEFNEIVKNIRCDK